MLYCYRYKVEVFFRSFNQCIAGLDYHFWNKRVPILKKFESAKATVERLAKITDIKDRSSIIRTYNAIEGFVMLCCIAIGIIQICALKYTQAINDSPIRWLRTYTNIVPSEESTQVSLRNCFNRLFDKCPKLSIVKIISKVRAEFDPFGDEAG
jgi:hypothetical protein